MRKPKREKPLLLRMKGKLQLLFTFLFYLSYNLDEAATSISSAPTKWKLQLQMYKHQLVHETFTVSPCSSLHP